jgi:AcrR family transcriptional regulator
MTLPQSEASKSAQTNRRGRHLDPTRDAAILNAVLEVLAERGYDRLTMDAVATHAHAGKGAIYRRWPSKAALVVDAVISWRETRAPVVSRDTGSLRGDLNALVDAMPEFGDGDQEMIDVILGLVTTARSDEKLASAINSNMMERPREVLSELFARAVARGEVPATRDLSLVPDMIMGLNILFMALGRPINRTHVRRVVNDVVIPLALGRTDD